jgi:diguanylate cyclase (GGDEF)-like protein
MLIAPLPSRYKMLWKTYLAIVLGAVGVFFFIPGDSVAQTAVKVGIGWVAAAAIVIGVRRNQVAVPLPWYLFAAGVFLNASGILVEAYLSRNVVDPPSPSLADVFWLALYPAVFVGLALIIRRRSAGRDWATIVDWATVSTGLGLLCWVFLIHPATIAEADSRLAHGVIIAYPAADVVVLAMLARLLIGAGDRSPSYFLMVGSVLAFLAGDIGWALTSQLAWEPGTAASHLLDMIFLVAYALFGAAALHPTVREVGEQAPKEAPRLSPSMLALLTVASLIAPCVLLMEAARGQVTDGVAIGLCATALFLLVVTRMAQLLRQVEAQAINLREIARVDELTGLPNRRAWDSDLTSSIERARRDLVPLSIAMIDLDHFKAFNDEFGHPAGDRLLKSAAAAWLEQMRAADGLARYGGEEFILLFHESSADQAVEVLSRLRAVTPAGQTFSGGVASWDGDETSDELVARADSALYAAKAAGRDRVMVAAAAGGRDLASHPA